MLSGIIVFATSSVAGERVSDLCRCFVAPCYCPTGFIRANSYFGKNMHVSDTIILYILSRMVGRRFMALGNTMSCNFLESVSQ